MNIIYMHTHDSGRYWSPYGYSLPTPNLMNLAKQSTLFRHCYCAGPTCSPSRAALLTGMNPHSCGMRGLASRGFKLNDYNQHLVSFLNNLDYHTVLCGIQHEAPDYKMIGYREVIGSQEFNMNETEKSMEEWDYGNTQAACEYLKTMMGQKQPFFLSMGFFNTHREFPMAKNNVNPDYLAPPAPLYDCDVNRKDMADYHESVRVVDNCAGMLLSVLKDTGLSENTMIIATTDHGIAFPKMKCTLYDTGIGVALMIKYPNNSMAGKATDALVSQIDIFPTICDLIGAQKPQWLEGHSMLPLLEGKKTKIRDEIFSEVTYHAAYEPKRCVRTDRYKLIRFYDYHNGIVPANIDECKSKDFLFDNGYMEYTRIREYLYDLWLDPYERENFVDAKEYGTIYGDLSLRLNDWMEKTDDPLRHNTFRVPAPKGAKINKLTCINPRMQDFE